MENPIKKVSTIKIDVGLNENNVPQEMHWSAQDGKVSNEEARAMLLSLWDPRSKNTMKIDLWTTEMSVDEMKIFFHLAETLSLWKLLRSNWSAWRGGIAQR